MPIEQLKSKSLFDDFVKGSDLSLVHFYALWAPQCTQLNTILEDLVVDLKEPFRAAFIDAEGVPEVSKQCSIKAAPVVLFFKNGKEVDRVEGFKPVDIRLKVQQHTGNAPAAAASGDTSAAEPLNERLKRLISKSRLMLFMKGNREGPRCGFSKQVVALLAEHNADYETFDILADEEVRQGLKEYSNWPTYPQLYLDGELIGGLDVIREELQDPDFAANLPKKA